ncbi:carbonic anhydrase [Litoribacter ruber]|uniref:carbonic anhydrase family protein n=1 Tax=Litoribacter ruber TaxID=702568 RepID=UPI001BD9E8BD|nr:carbonic anhydrase family protein [Litoribacter ruber]MBT0810812.1 carbonic anhydrase [Litoribacter ruber]
MLKAHTKDTQSQINPDKAIEILKEGNERFVKNLKAERNLLEQVQDTTMGQFPFATVLSCMDSRTSVELIFDQGIGDIFSIRVAGNVVNEDVLGSMEYGCKAVGTRIVLVLGHTKCGAVAGACDHFEMGNLTSLLKKIEPAMERAETSGEKNGQNVDYVNEVVKKNVEVVIEQIRDKSPIVADLEKSGDIKIVGAIYDVDNGKVTWL